MRLALLVAAAIALLGCYPKTSTPPCTINSTQPWCPQPIGDSKAVDAGPVR
jgi:hypothetical protein